MAINGGQCEGLSRRAGRSGYLGRKHVGSKKMRFLREERPEQRSSEQGGGAGS